MTNVFRILWFEDNTTWFSMELRKVQRHLGEEYGLKVETTRSTGADFNPSILKDDNSFDLILMDYKLAAGNTGRIMVDLIRGNSVLTDVLLYSSEYDAMIGELKADNPLIDGVFFADRKNELFENKLFGIVHKIVRRSEDIVNLRGFFLDNTSDFEIRIKELLNLAWHKLPDEQDYLEEIMCKYLDGNSKRTKKTIETVKSNPPLYLSANNDKYALTIANRINVLSEIIRKIIERYGVTIPADYNEANDFSRNYSDDISVYRNSLSHRKYSDTTLVINGKTIIIDESLHQKLRRNISKYDQIIGYLETTIAEL